MESQTTTPRSATTEADPWDVALFGTAEASMYKSSAPSPAPASPKIEVPIKTEQKPSQPVPNFFAGIPRDVTEAIPVIISQPKPTPLANVPKAPKLEFKPIANPSVVPPIKPRPTETGGLSTTALLLVGIPLFISGFLIADYVKAELSKSKESGAEYSASMRLSQPR